MNQGSPATRGQRPKASAAAAVHDRRPLEGAALSEPYDSTSWRPSAPTPSRGSAAIQIGAPAPRRDLLVRSGDALANTSIPDPTSGSLLARRKSPPAPNVATALRCRASSADPSRVSVAIPIGAPAPAALPPPISYLLSPGAQRPPICEICEICGPPPLLPEN
jgi:hypothetical protein